VEAIELFQFPFSHYNEKARWALDWKGIAHRRIDLLPGPHAPRIARLTGKTTVPVLRIGERVIAGSAEIIDELERLQPEPALYPADSAQRERALALERHFDDEVGPRVRRALFTVLLREPAYLVRVFAGRRSAPVRIGYRALFPITKQVVGRSMSVFDRAAVDDAFAGTERALDLVAKQVGASGYLVGDRFGVADLTAASMLALLVRPEHPDMARPTPMPESLHEFLARWADHPAAHWALEQYRRHRPLRAPTDPD
jgi:glutathione S-transferase